MAKRFRFRLEPVLKYRANQEHEVMRDFAQSQSKVVEQEQYLEGLADEKAGCQDELLNMYDRQQDFQNVVEYQRYINTINIRAVLGQRELRQRNTELDEKREVLLEARKKRRALELLKERRQEEFTVEENREEARNLDELAVQRFRARSQQE